MADFKISFLDVSAISDGELSAHYGSMSESRKKETDALPSEIKKKQKIAADMLCRRMICEKCGIPENEIVFSKNGFGKPFAENADVFFSVSHSGNIVACAVSDKEIGIDIEKTKSVRLKAAEKFSTASELEYIGNDLTRFFRVWTLKEAFFKCKGTGLGSDIRSVFFRFDREEIICSENGYELFAPTLADGYTCSVCIKK